MNVQFVYIADIRTECGNSLFTARFNYNIIINLNPNVKHFCAFFERTGNNILIFSELSIRNKYPKQVLSESFSVCKCI